MFNLENKIFLFNLSNSNFIKINISFYLNINRIEQNYHVYE